MKAITAEAILGLAGDLLAEGTEVWGPGVVHGRIEYRRLRGAADLKLDAELPAFPLKRLFLPPSEPLFEWRRMQGELSLVPAPHRSRPIVVLGARPCDASALEAVDRVMGW